MRSLDLKSMEKEEHKLYHRRIIYVIIIILIFLFGGATFYHYVEHWRYIDAMYFSAATMTTVGYGDITPKTDLGKIFTIIFVFTGVGIVLYGLSIMAAHFVEIREEVWLERLGKIKLRDRTQSFWTRLKDILFYEAKDLAPEDFNEKNKK